MRTALGNYIKNFSKFNLNNAKALGMESVFKSKF